MAQGCSFTAILISQSNADKEKRLEIRKWREGMRITWCRVEEVRDPANNQ